MRVKQVIINLANVVLICSDIRNFLIFAFILGFAGVCRLFTFDYHLKLICCVGCPSCMSVMPASAVGANVAL